MGTDSFFNIYFYKNNSERIHCKYLDSHHCSTFFMNHFGDGSIIPSAYFLDFLQVIRGEVKTLDLKTSNINIFNNKL